ncbi:type I restriction endonuclease [Escherichia coli]|nr:type I restriction endonuclease [Escherichia coli]
MGYYYLSLKEQRWDKETNIFPDLFTAAIGRINPGLAPDDIGRLLKDLTLLLDNDDLGRAFFEKLSDRSGIKLIDFDNFNNNSFHVVTELTCENDDEEFRPDITLLINGMPLIFIEVKKPNNREGIVAERNRINERFKNPKFKRFANITQFMIFSITWSMTTATRSRFKGILRQQLLQQPGIQLLPRRRTLQPDQLTETAVRRNRDRRPERQQPGSHPYQPGIPDQQRSQLPD